MTEILILPEIWLQLKNWHHLTSEGYFRWHLFSPCDSVLPKESPPPHTQTPTNPPTPSFCEVPLVRNCQWCTGGEWEQLISWGLIEASPLRYVIYPYLVSMTCTAGRILLVKPKWSNTTNLSQHLGLKLKVESLIFYAKSERNQILHKCLELDPKFVGSHLVMLCNVAEHTLWQLCKLWYLCVFSLWVQSPQMVNCSYILFYLNNVPGAKFQFNLQELWF